MKFCYIILAIVLCVVSTEGRNVHQQDTNSDLNENIDNKHIKNKPERRLRNRRQSYFHNYHNFPDYGNSFQNMGAGDFLRDILLSVREIATQMKQGVSSRYYPGYYDYRNDYNKCEDSLKELLTLYRELASHLKSSPPPPPPPPQIIYVHYPVPSTCNHAVDKTDKNVTIKDRIPEDTDINRIWMDTPKETGTDDDGDGSRPVSFKPKEPKRPHIQPPPFEHGSTQAGIKTTTVQTIRKPGPCEGAILSCCGLKTEEEREKCFAASNCSKSYETGLACNADIIKMVLDDFSRIYGPVNEF